jgi:ribosomal protein S24E
MHVQVIQRVEVNMRTYMHVQVIQRVEVNMRTVYELSHNFSHKNLKSYLFDPPHQYIWALY